MIQITDPRMLDPNVIPIEEALPLPGKRVIVVCKSFRCLGYREREGTWRDDAREKQLPNVIAWHPLSEDPTEGRWG